MYWIYISLLFSKKSWSMYWTEFIEDLYEKCSTSNAFRIQFQTTAARIAVSEGAWRLPSSPIVEKQMCISLCKFFITWNMYWIHISLLFSKKSWNMYWSEFIEDLYEKVSTSLVLYIQNRKTAARTPDSQPHWRLPSSPIVEKNVHFLM